MDRSIIIPLIILLLFAIILFIAYLASEKPAPPHSFLPIHSNDYSSPLHWKGTPIDRKGRFLNSEFPFYQNYLHIISFVPGHTWNLVKNFFAKSSVELHANSDFLHKNNTLIWLGHSSFFLRLDNLNILIDPQFYHAFPYLRHTKIPIAPKLFRDIDYVLLSHDHADHFDPRSLRELMKNNPQTTFLAGLKMDSLLKSVGKENVNCITADWYQRFPIKDEVEIYFVPTRHYCKRIFQKFNSRLWGGFILKFKISSTSYYTIYFGGDSGFGGHYKDVKTVFSPDLAILGIGAFKPEWFMHPNHMSPKEALQAFEDCGASSLIPMHYSTFNLSSENMKAPIKSLLKHAGNQHILKLQIGETLPLPPLKP